jgi:transposase
MFFKNVFGVRFIGQRVCYNYYTKQKSEVELMHNTLKKRDCNINIKLTPSGAQYLHFEMSVDGDYFDFLPASTVGVQFGALVSALYKLFIEDIEDENVAWGKHEYLSDENHHIHTVVTKVSWDNEGTDIDIIFSRKISREIDYENDMMTVEIQSYDEELKKFSVKSKDFCYAVAKACTEALKEYGFYGYRYSTEYDYFILYQLLYIKSFALGNFEARRLSPENENWCAKKTSFEKEIELLLFDM